MRVVFQMSAIVAALALAGCGQNGALYLPTVPPLPPKPIEQMQPSPSDVAPDAETASARSGTAPDVSGTPLTLSPELAPQGVLRTAPAPASDATPAQ
ncbi:LPS translocon maturation chaperone LptM [Burkholderia alba]|uniref:LPS translocon maturation chaperone LptM n=1 Tax=Burkholderia alba TaxID=2683677 RepID=UPI002B060B8D|nr:lipoprotein [Burkholderia alba]